jgi:hypothetical protein
MRMEEKNFSKLNFNSGEISTKGESRQEEPSCQPKVMAVKEFLLVLKRLSHEIRIYLKLNILSHFSWFSKVYVS